MTRLSLIALLVAFVAVPIAGAPVPKAPPSESPMLGGTPARNMVNLREKLPALPNASPDWEHPKAAKQWEEAYVLWKANLGSRAYGGPTIAGGRIYIGTNNEQPRNRRDTQKLPTGKVVPIDKGILMCFDQKTGMFLWQAVHDRLPNGIVTDWPKEGICSTPTVVGNRVYYVSNRCTVVCADVNGFADGNQGIQNEQYNDATDADIIWEYDMIKELQVFPHNKANCSPLVVGDRIFVCTSNGVDESHIKLPSPDAPSLICLNRHTGKLLWFDNSPGSEVMHGQWSSPSYTEDPVPQVLHAQGDGWLRAFDPATGKLLWKFDCNDKNAIYELGGTGTRNDFIAMPAIHNGRVYIGTGQDPEHSTGIAALWCIDLTKAVTLGAKSKDRDVSPVLIERVEKNPLGMVTVVTKPNPASALVWSYGGVDTRKWAVRDFRFGRTLSTVAVVDDIVYAAELSGQLHCINAKTGEHYWMYDTKAMIWGSPLYIDGKVLLATEMGEIFIFKHTPKPDAIDYLGGNDGEINRKDARILQRAARELVAKKYLHAQFELPAPIRTTPLVVVSGVLYVATENTLYAIRQQ